MMIFEVDDELSGKKCLTKRVYQSLLTADTRFRASGQQAVANEAQKYKLQLSFTPRIIQPGLLCHGPSAYK